MRAGWHADVRVEPGENPHSGSIGPWMRCRRCRIGRAAPRRRALARSKAGPVRSRSGLESPIRDRAGLVVDRFDDDTMQTIQASKHNSYLKREREWQDTVPSLGGAEDA